MNQYNILHFKAFNHIVISKSQLPKNNWLIKFTYCEKGETLNVRLGNRTDKIEMNDKIHINCYNFNKFSIKRSQIQVLKNKIQKENLYYQLL